MVFISLFYLVIPHTHKLACSLPICDAQAPSDSFGWIPPDAYGLVPYSGMHQTIVHPHQIQKSLFSRAKYWLMNTSKLCYVCWLIDLRL